MLEELVIELSQYFDEHWCELAFRFLTGVASSLASRHVVNQCGALKRRLQQKLH